MTRIRFQMQTALVALALTIPAALFGLSAPAAAQEVPGVAGPYIAAENAARRNDISEAARLYLQVLARDPQNVDLMQNALTFQLAAGQVGRAIPIARRLQELSPGDHLGVLLLAADAMKRDAPAEARALLAVSENENAPFVGQLIDAWVAYSAGDTDAARGLLAGIEEKKTGGAAGAIVSAYHAGLMDAALGSDEEALAAIERAVKLANNSTPRLTRVRAGILARLGRTDDAREVIADYLALTLGDRRLEALDRDLAAGRVPAPVVTSGPEGAAEALFGVAGYLARGNSWQIGLAYTQLGAYLKPDLVEARLLIAGILQQRQQYDLAIEAYEAVPGDAPETLEAEIGRAEAMWAAGRKDESIAALRLTVAAHPRWIEAHTTLGDLLRRDEQFAEAAKAYDGALALVAEPESRHWPLYYQRGIALERSKQWDRAEADFMKALELEPDQPLVLNYLGYSWVEMRRNLAEAQAMIEKAVEKRPEDGYIVDSLGWVLFRVGKFDGAAKHLERAVELRPVDPVINDHFGDALWMVGRRTEARFQWKRALSFEPEEQEAERIRRKLVQGLDKILAEEEAAGNPAIFPADGTATNTTSNDGG
ncbi:MAG: tetratricopeptide repeat protein [Paracoccaceae bacterium]|nr:tetratricopeptide repeat protein [Paracoccaceae bacterium]